MAIFAYTGWMAFSGDGKYKNSVNYVKGMKALQDSKIWDLAQCSQLC